MLGFLVFVLLNKIKLDLAYLLSICAYFLFLFIKTLQANPCILLQESIIILSEISLSLAN